MLIIKEFFRIYNTTVSQKAKLVMILGERERKFQQMIGKKYVCKRREKRIKGIETEDHFQLNF